MRVWDSDTEEATHVFKHNNQTGRWVSPFRAVWSANGDVVFCGDMRRGLCSWMLGDEVEERLLQSEHTTAICPRIACHPRRPVVATASSSGRVHLWTLS